MISVDEAVEIVINNTDVLEPRLITINEAMGFFLAEDIISDIDMPPFNRSAMDGYALIAEDIEDVPCDLEVIETISAGCAPEKQVRKGLASKIMTGAIVPEGADTVIMVEDTESIDNGARVRIMKQTKKGKNIALKGEDVESGQVVLKKGQEVRPQEIGVLASVGAERFKVFRSPNVGIIATGDELVEINVKPGAGQIRNSNGYSLAAQARQIVNDVEILEVAADNQEKICSIIELGLKKDVLILSGGVSMGDYDFVGKVLKEMEVEVFFEKVSLRPGKPTLFAKKGRTHIFALPGNPVATFVTFELFVYPAIRKMRRSASLTKPVITAVLETDYIAKKKRTEYRPAYIKLCDGKFRVKPVNWHGSGDLLSITNANCLLIVPEEIQKMDANQDVNVMLLSALSANENI